MTNDSAKPLRHTPPNPMGGSRLSRIFALAGGPAAWLLLVCAGDALASGGCYRGNTPQWAAWTWTALVALLIICVLISVAAFLLSWRALRRTPVPAESTARQLTAGGGGGGHFMALWATVLAAGSVVATLMSIVAYAALPHCGR